MDKSEPEFEYSGIGTGVIIQDNVKIKSKMGVRLKVSVGFRIKRWAQIEIGETLTIRGGIKMYTKTTQLRLM